VSVVVTDHARERWDDRTQQPSFDPIVAWIQGVEVEGTSLDGDEVRYHAWTDTCLVRKDTAIVTVVDVSSATRQTRKAVAALDRGDER